MDLSNRDGRKILGERIKSASKETGISLEDLAIKIGCSRGLIYQYVSGASLAQPDRLQQIAVIVGKPLSWFFEDPSETITEPPQPDNNILPSSTVPSQSDTDWAEEKLAYIQALIYAHSSPPNWRAVSDYCQQQQVLLPKSASEKIAENLFTQGNALLRLQDFNAGRTKLQEASVIFRELTNNDRHLDCLQSIGHAEIHLGRTKQALHTFQQVSEGQLWRHRWQGALSLGATYEMLGDYTSAANCLIKAQEIADENTNTGEKEITHLYIDSNWVNLQIAWGDYERASETSQRCIMTAQRIGEQDQYLEALINYAYSSIYLGDFVKALNESERLINVSQLVSDTERWSIGLSIKSLCYTYCRSNEESIINAKEALSMALRNSMHRAELMAQRAISLAYLSSGNIIEAKYHINQSIASTDADNLKYPNLQFKTLKAHYLVLEGKYNDASALINEILDEAINLESKQVQYDCYYINSLAEHMNSSFNNVIANAERAAETADQMRIDIHQWRVLSLLAIACYKTGDTNKAETNYRKAIAYLNAHRRQIMETCKQNTLNDDPAVTTLLNGYAELLSNTERDDEAKRILQDTDWELPVTRN